MAAAVCGAFVAVVGLAGSSRAEAKANLAEIRRIHVAPIEDSAGAEQTRARLVQRLRSMGFEIASDPVAADATLKASERIWVSGYFSAAIRSRGVRQAVCEGYIGVEIQGKDGETLWSYLVTPGPMSFSGLVKSLADGIVRELLAALKEQPALPAARATGAKPGATLEGAGATFPAPLYMLWFEAFSKEQPGIRISYEPVGSETGLSLMKQGRVDFAASDVPLSLSEAEASRVLQVPTVLGAVVPIYNVPGVTGGLRLTGEALAGIYMGKVVKWNDPLIASLNRSVGLPASDIVVVHRSDGSGTSFAFTEYLSKVSALWKDRIGPGTTVAWPVGIGAERNEGVASLVQKTPNAIGYVELIYAIQHQLAFASVRNPAGHFVRASLETVSAAAEGTAANPLEPSITNSPRAAAYPISSFTWLLLADVEPGSEKRAAEEALLRWILSIGQKKCSFLGYAPLPPPTAKEAAARLP